MQKNQNNYYLSTSLDMPPDSAKFLHKSNCYILYVCVYACIQTMNEIRPGQMSLTNHSSHCWSSALQCCLTVLNSWGFPNVDFPPDSELNFLSESPTRSCRFGIKRDKIPNNMSGSNFFAEDLIIHPSPFCWYEKVRKFTSIISSLHSSVLHKIWLSLSAKSVGSGLHQV